LLDRLDRLGRADDSGGRQSGDWDAETVGDRLLDVVTRARSAGVDAEAALRASVRALELRARAAERSPGRPAR
jgi:hypothetical protein